MSILLDFDVDDVIVARDADIPCNTTRREGIPIVLLVLLGRSRILCIIDNIFFSLTILLLTLIAILFYDTPTLYNYYMILWGTIS